MSHLLVYSVQEKDFGVDIFVLRYWVALPVSSIGSRLRSLLTVTARPIAIRAARAQPLYQTEMPGKSLKEDMSLFCAGTFSQKL